MNVAKPCLPLQWLPRLWQETSEMGNPNSGNWGIWNCTWGQVKTRTSALEKYLT